jgi:hypothetical protein
MLTYEDCVALSGLTKREIDAIAEHEHIPAMIAAELANYLCQNSAGECCIRRYILDDIAAAEGRGDLRHALFLKAVLKHFIETHPRAAVTTPQA